MIQRRARLSGLVVLLALISFDGAHARASHGTDTLPERLSDEAFWQLSDRFSEPDGYFRSDNLLSNELRYPEVIPGLVRLVEPGGVYLGVGPEQNFNYIAAIRPKIAFITDVRRGNLYAHLMYKALFELSADRVEFLSRLFTKPRPRGLGPTSTVGEIVDGFWFTDTGSQADYDRNVRAIRDQLTKAHALPLTAEDLQRIEDVYFNFYWYGPSITYNSSNGSGFGRGSMAATYADLMVAVDADGRPRSFLATEDSFRFIKDLEARNLVVPVVGDFAGPRALRAIGAFLREHGAVVSAFYLSNVEQYLRQDFKWEAFCANVASMPLDERSTFIRSMIGNSGGYGRGFTNFLGPMQAETDGCATGAPAAVGSRR